MNFIKIVALSAFLLTTSCATPTEQKEDPLLENLNINEVSLSSLTSDEITDYSEKYYLGTSKDFCDMLNFDCEESQIRFNDETGCGCLLK